MSGVNNDPTSRLSTELSNNSQKFYIIVNESEDYKHK